MTAVFYKFRQARRYSPVPEVITAMSVQQLVGYALLITLIGGALFAIHRHRRRIAARRRWH